MKFAKMLGAIALSSAIAVTVHAVPALQLDIVGGTYDPMTEDIVSSAPVFDLVAVLNPTAGNAPPAMPRSTSLYRLSRKPRRRLPVEVSNSPAPP